jgi:Zn-dependent M28 family amino/carboxypeptidase
MERARQTGDIGTAMAMGLKQIPYIEAGTSQGQAIPIQNVKGVSGASSNIFGVESGLSMGKAKQKKGIWDSLLGSGGLLGGLFG